MAETLCVQVRTKSTKGSARAVRRAGAVPGLLYGAGRDVRLLSVESKVLAKQIERGRIFLTVYALDFGDGTKHEQALVRDIHYDPVRDVPIHLDFQRITARSRLTVEVPVRFLNQESCRGLKRGGILNIVRHDISLICQAENIPDFIDVDLAEADIGDSLHVSHVTLPAQVSLTIQDRDFTIATIAAPKVAMDEEDQVDKEEEEKEEDKEAEKGEKGEN